MAIAVQGRNEKSPTPVLSRRSTKRPIFSLAKRSLDIAISTCILVVSGPLLLFAALLIKLTSSGPVLYRAKRAGLAGEPFVMFKLRTMKVDSDTTDRKITADEDDRVTAVGHWLRRFKLDELPQLWNVLRGDMSIVGPRPEDWDIVDQYYSSAQRRALEVRPGLASPVDVDWYPDMTYHDPAPIGVAIQAHYLQRHLPVQVAEAIRYVDNQSLLADLSVIFRLIYCVLVRSWLPAAKRPLPTGPQ